MKITVFSMTFWPNIGGLENIMGGLAECWSDAGHEVTVATDTKAGNSFTSTVFPILRQPSLFTLWKKVRDSDIFIEANISLKTCFIGIWHRKKWVVVHHLPYQHDSGWKGRLKNRLTKLSHNIAVSRYVADQLSGTSIVIPNFYNPLFRKLEQVRRDRDFVFLGRLVSDKGVSILIEAFAQVLPSLPGSTLTIIGEGPEKENLVQQVKVLGLQEQVSFAGIVQGEPLVQLLNRHQVMVVPSTWEEPFGIIVLEGLASGCAIVCSDKGGLAEAAGNWGLYYPNNDPKELSIRMQQALERFAAFEKQYDAVMGYLSNKQQVSIAQHYLSYFKTLRSIL